MPAQKRLDLIVRQLAALIIMDNSDFTMKRLFFFLLMCSAAGCAEQPKETVTRLYVADTDSARRLVTVYEPANSAAPPAVRTINTGLTQGVWVDVISDVMIHAGIRTVRIYNVASAINGNVPPTSEFTDTALTNPREITYDNLRKILYVANDLRREVRIYDNAPALSGAVQSRRILTPAPVWSVFHDTPNNRLFVLLDRTGCDSIYIYNNPETKTETSPPDQVLRLTTTFPNKARYHGLWYSNRRDVLYVTDIGSGNDGSLDGSIYILADVKSVLAGNLSQPVVPTRTISGALTGMNNPADIDVDDRDGFDDIYVPDKGANVRKVFVFSVNAEGNAPPKTVIPFEGVPEDVFLDIFSPKP